MDQQHTEETSFWLNGLIRLLDTVPKEWRQEAFDTYVSGEDTRGYENGLTRIANKYGINLGTRETPQIQIRVTPLTNDVELSGLKGSVRFDIFYRGNLEELLGYENFKRDVESRGAKVSYFPKRGMIRVHNDDNEIPIEILGRAHKWAHEIELSHAYK